MALLVPALHLVFREPMSVTDAGCGPPGTAQKRT